MKVPAASRAAPTARRWASLHGAPVSWIPTGRPSASAPTGTVSEGRPHRFCSTVEGMIAARSGERLPADDDLVRIGGRARPARADRRHEHGRHGEDPQHRGPQIVRGAAGLQVAADVDGAGLLEPAADVGAVAVGLGRERPEHVLVDVKGLGHLHRREDLEQAGSVRSVDLDLLAADGAQAVDDGVERRTPAVVGSGREQCRGHGEAEGRRARRSAASVPACRAEAVRW